MKLIDIILHSIKSANLEKGEYKVLFEGSEGQAKNQYLFFTKPELVRNISDKTITNIFSLIISKIITFDFYIQSVVLLTGKYLNHFNIIQNHYGVIDQVAHSPQTYYSDQVIKSFKNFYSKDIRKCNVLGGFDYIENFGISIDELTKRWNSCTWVKLAGGMYCIHLEEEDIYLINGFYPGMLNHFTRSDSILISFILTGNEPWKTMRNEFLGVTDPRKAKKGSLRKELLLKKNYFGLAKISSNFNGVHLSAGPVEALVELMRFMNNMYSKKGQSLMTNFIFGRQLYTNFRKSEIDLILTNCTIKYQEANVSVFDLTEEMDANKAIEILKEVEFNQNLG